MSIKSTLVAGALLTLPMPVWLVPHGQSFFFAEETSRLPEDITLPGTSSTDVDLVDVDNDGDLDLFIAEGTDSIEPRPNRLLLNNGSGEFTDVSATNLPPGPHANSTKVEFGDLDGDGDLDLVVGNSGENGGERVFIQYSRGVGRGRWLPAVSCRRDTAMKVSTIHT